MSALFLDSPEGLKRTLGLASIASDYTACWWVYVTGFPAPADGQTFLVILDDSIIYTDYIWIGGGNFPQGAHIDVKGTTSGLDASLTTGWHHFAYRRTGTLHELFIDGVLGDAVTRNVAAFTIGEMYLGTDTYAADWLGSRTAFFREWSTALTLAEINVERYHAPAQRRTNLLTDTPLAVDRLDDSGNGHTWIDSGGVVTFDIQPDLVAVTDQSILSQIQRNTLEGVGDGGWTWPSGMWTQAEVLGYLAQRQNRFLAATGLFWTHLETAITINQNEQPAPSDWIATIFLAFKSGAGIYTELPKVDTQELDLILPTWPGSSSADPRGYYEIDGATLTTYVVPIPTDAGSALERFYVALGTAFDASGVTFAVSPEFVSTIKYGCLADMFSKVGPAANPILAASCEERWTEGVEMGKLMAQEGWFVL